MISNNSEYTSSKTNIIPPTKEDLIFAYKKECIISYDINYNVGGMLSFNGIHPFDEALNEVKYTYLDDIEKKIFIYEKERDSISAGSAHHALLDCKVFLLINRKYNPDLIIWK